MKKLTQIQVKNGTGKLFDGGGLMLIKSGATGKWVYRYSHLGRRREMGLGTWPTVSLADARTSRDEWASVLAQDRDPISVRDRRRQEAIAERDKHDPTLEELVRAVFEARRATLRGDGTRGRWLSPLQVHVFPKLGKRRASGITSAEFRDVLKPIWRTKHPTAKKCANRLRLSFREGKLMGLPVDPFTVEAAVKMLGEVRHVAVPTPSTPWRDMPALYRRLGNSSVDLCLRHAMLTLVRLDGVRGARLTEVRDAVWTVPEDRVKGLEGQVTDFRVPLSREAIRVVEEAADVTGDMLFPGKALRGPVTDRALEKRLDTLGEVGRPHGFRASFRSWVQDTEACSYEVAETILGHSVGNRVERSYARSDLLDLRRPVMDAWALHLTSA